jgi:hypothetical protein
MSRLSFHIWSWPVAWEYSEQHISMKDGAQTSREGRGVGFLYIACPSEPSDLLFTRTFRKDRLILFHFPSELHAGVDTVEMSEETLKFLISICPNDTSANLWLAVQRTPCGSWLLQGRGAIPWLHHLFGHRMSHCKEYKLGEHVWRETRSGSQCCKSSSNVSSTGTLVNRDDMSKFTNTLMYWKPMSSRLAIKASEYSIWCSECPNTGQTKPGKYFASQKHGWANAAYNRLIYCKLHHMPWTAN